ncbi:MAG: hypothetical protein AAGF23_07160 [Acidobacteriota bacterium]
MNAPPVGFGHWTNPVDAPFCNSVISGIGPENGGGSVVCAEFIDDLEFSPLTGTLCCVDRSQLASNSFYESCLRELGRTPKQDFAGGFPGSGGRSELDRRVYFD